MTPGPRRSVLRLRGNRSTALAVGALVLLVGTSVPGGLATAAARGPSPAASSTSPVTFSLTSSAAGALSLSVAFTVTFDSSGGNITPGETVTAGTSVVAPSTMQLGVGLGGASTSIPVAPLGSLADVPIPGLTFSYLGASLGLYLNLSGEIEAQSAVAGPGSGGGGPLAWNSSMTHTFPVTANRSAPPGSALTLGLSDIRYSLALGVEAGGDVPFLGYRVVPVLNFGSLGVVNGTPSSLNSTYDLPSSDVGGGSVADLSGGVLADLLFLAAAIVAVVATVVVLRARSRRG